MLAPHLAFVLLLLRRIRRKSIDFNNCRQDLHTYTCSQDSKFRNASGRAYTFGSNQWGQLALGHTEQTNKPSFVKSLKGNDAQCYEESSFILL